MGFSVPQIKAAIKAAADRFGISADDTQKIIVHMVQNDGAGLRAFINAGDVAGIMAAAGAVGVRIDGGAGIPGKDQTRKRSRQKKSTAARQESTPEKLETVAGDIVPGGITSPDLPDGFADRVDGWLLDYAQRYDIDLGKCAGLQWRAACIYVGRQIQDSKVLRDAARERVEGGKLYKPERVAALVPIWEYFTLTYKHTPLTCDFIAFAGVSNEWFYDSGGRGLSSSRVEMVQKVKAIEAAGISSGLVDGRENPTGKIFYSKARLGWSEAPRVLEVVHSTAPAASALPDFGGDLPKIAEKGAASGFLE